MDTVMTSFIYLDKKLKLEETNSQIYMKTLFKWQEKEHGKLRSGLCGRLYREITWYKGSR